MAEEQSKEDRPLVERWLEDQQEWQKTMLRYMDSMANNEEFLVHLGNAMRGSLLAGKPYPGTEPPASEAEGDQTKAEPVPGDERLDRILFTLHEIQGQLNDLHLTVERLTAMIEGERPAGGDSNNENQADATHARTEANPAKSALHDRSARGRSSRTIESASAQPKMRRSSPRSAFGRRGEPD